MGNFIAIKVRNMKIWNADQRMNNNGKIISVKEAFVNNNEQLFSITNKRLVNEYLQLQE